MDVRPRPKRHAALRLPSAAPRPAEILPPQMPNPENDTFTPPTLTRTLVMACIGFASAYEGYPVTQHEKRERVIEHAEVAVTRILAQPAAEDLLGRL